MKDRGFTLVELLIVLAVIGILAAIAIPSFLGIQERTKKRVIIANVEASMRQLHAWLTGLASTQMRQEAIDCDGDGVTDDLITDEGCGADQCSSSCPDGVFPSNPAEGTCLAWVSLKANDVSIYDSSRPQWVYGGNQSSGFIPPSSDPQHAGQIVLYSIGERELAVAGYDKTGASILWKRLISTE